MLSQTVEYALRAAVCLAEPSDAPHTTDQIAAKTRVPRAYLSKVLQGLVKAGIATSHRGIGGGITLAIEPDKLTILDVVNAVEPIKRIDNCPLGLKSHGVHLCPLHRRLDNALASLEAAFASTTLAEVLAEPTASIPLCETLPDLPDGDSTQSYQTPPAMVPLVIPTSKPSAAPKKPAATKRSGKRPAKRAR